MSIVISAAHAAQTMNAQDKGSVVNRAKCTGEHLKNDLKYGFGTTAVGTLGAGLGVVAYRNPAACVKVAGKVGKLVTTVGKWLNKLKLPKVVKNVPTAIEKFGTKVMNGAPKYGKIGVLAAIAGATLLGIANLAKKQAYNAGKIDQKYIDNAKIEKMTGSVVV